MYKFLLLQKTDFKNPYIYIYIYIYYSINYNIYFKLNIDIIDTKTDNQLVTRPKIDTSMTKNDTKDILL